MLNWLSGYLITMGVAECHQKLHRLYIIIITRLCNKGSPPSFKAGSFSSTIFKSDFFGVP